MSARPRRILIVTPYYHPVVGGVETHARELAAGLRRRGRRAFVLTTRTASGSARSVERLDGAAVIRRPPSIGRQRFTKWLFLPPAFLTMVALRRRVDVLFCPDLRGVGLAAVGAGRLLHLPVVLQGATPGAYSLSHWTASLARLPVPVPAFVVTLARRAVLAVHRRASAVVCLTAEHAAEARAAGIAPDRIRYLPHGVDLQRFRPARAGEAASVRRRLGWPDGLTVLYLGRLSAEKGVLESPRGLAPPGAARARAAGNRGSRHVRS